MSGRAALVTGAGVGIGQACAVALGEAGAFVGVHFHSSSAGAEETLATIRKAGGDGIIIKADLNDEAAANAMVDQFVKAGGGLNVLVNNAGALVGRATIEDTTLDMWNRTLDINLTSAFIVTRRAIPALRASGKGSIINVLSLSVQTGGANGAGAYAAAKGGMTTFTRTLARELAPQVRTNAVMPGVIETRHHEVATTEERMAEYRKQTPLARNGQADEVGTVIRFLAGDESSFVNGAMIDINGGRFLR
jgi:3-oxoacyl-[acyl-carrier protein] reductase